MNKNMVKWIVAAKELYISIYDASENVGIAAEQGACCRIGCVGEIATDWSRISRFKDIFVWIGLYWYGLDGVYGK